MAKMGLRQLLLLVVAALLVEMSIQITSKLRAGVPLRKVAKRDNRLCGPDLVREMRFLCGDMDWKRSSLQEERNPQFPGGLQAVQMDSNEGLENVTFQSAPAPELNRLHDDHEPHAEPTPGNFLELYKRYKKHIVTVADDDAGQKRTDSVGMANPIGSGFPQVSHPRRKRQTYQEMADKCCYVGCSTQDIRRVFCSG